jgi:hypothetical protein
MYKLDFRKYLTWEGFLKEYNENKITEEEKEKKEFEFVQKFDSFYKYGKIQLLLVILNKFLLFFGIISSVLFLTKFFYVSKIFLSTITIFLFFDIFIDEKTICIPICDFFNNIIIDDENNSCFKFNFSLSIELSDEKKEKREEEKEEFSEKEKKHEDYYDEDEYDIKTI